MWKLLASGGGVGWNGRRAFAGAAIVVMLALGPMAVGAAGETVGYLYTALGANVERFEVGEDAELTAAGSVAGGAVTPSTPGSLVMAKTADGENLYELSKTGSTQTIHQYTVDSSTGVLTAMSPETVGSIPFPGAESPHFMAVLNPAATGAAGQNTLYVLAGASEHPRLYMFDIDANTGALTQVEAAGIVVPDTRVAAGLAYSGKTLVVKGGDFSGHEVFESATLDQSTGVPVFEPVADSPCPELACDEGAVFMLNEAEMLNTNSVLDVNARVPETYAPGVSSYEVGGSWSPIASYLTHRPGPLALSAIGNRYFGSEHLSNSPFEIEDGEFQTSEYGHSWIEEFAPEGAPEGFFGLPGVEHVPIALLPLGSEIYVANQSENGDSFATGERLTPSTGIAKELGSSLGAAMAGFLTGEFESRRTGKRSGQRRRGDAGRQSHRIHAHGLHRRRRQGSDHRQRDQLSGNVLGELPGGHDRDSYRPPEPGIHVHRVGGLVRWRGCVQCDDVGLRRRDGELRKRPTAQHEDHLRQALGQEDHDHFQGQRGLRKTHLPLQAGRR